MADLLTLPLHLSPEAARRLHDQLERDLAAGLDPGSRHGQIACLSGSITRSLQQLGEVVGRAVSELPAGDPTALKLREAANGVALIAQVVLGCAGACPLSPSDPIPRGVSPPRGA